jgi:DNA-binding NtrC family response regulator
MARILVVDALRSDGALHDIPVALCTATATADARREALRNGFTESIPKPYDLDVFRRDIDSFLATHCPRPAPGKAAAPAVGGAPPAAEGRPGPRRARRRRGPTAPARRQF